MKKAVGQFELEVWGPWPCSVTIRDKRGELRISHQELRDLEYVVAEAIRECNRKLGDRETIDGKLKERSNDA